MGKTGFREKHPLKHLRPDVPQVTGGGSMPAMRGRLWR